MEPIAPSAASGSLRPLASLASELSAVLRQGRVLVAEVLSSTGDGSVLLAIGRQRVPAETQVSLDPGQELLVKVEGTPDGIVLGILGDDSSDVSDLLRALRAVIGEDEPLGTLLAKLAHELGASPQGLDSGALEHLSKALAQSAFSPAEGAAGFLALFERAPIRFENLLSAALLAPQAAALFQRLRSNLKGELLSALERLDAGPLRGSLERMLASIEAEQLLNVARERAGEPLSWSVPVPDGESWATARLVFRRGRRSKEERREGDDGGRCEPLVVGVRFSRLGPVRAELTLEKDRLLARIQVARSEFVPRIQADFAQLARAMGRGRHSVQLLVRVVEEDQVDVESERLDIRFLREHRLMDVSG